MAKSFSPAVKSALADILGGGNGGTLDFSGGGGNQQAGLLNMLARSQTSRPMDARGNVLSPTQALADWRSHGSGTSGYGFDAPTSNADGSAKAPKNKGSGWNFNPLHDIMKALKLHVPGTNATIGSLPEIGGTIMTKRAMEGIGHIDKAISEGSPVEGLKALASGLEANPFTGAVPNLIQMGVDKKFRDQVTSGEGTGTQYQHLIDTHPDLKNAVTNSAPVKIAIGAAGDVARSPLNELTGGLGAAEAAGRIVSTADRAATAAVEAADRALPEGASWGERVAAREAAAEAAAQRVEAANRVAETARRYGSSAIGHEDALAAGVKQGLKVGDKTLSLSQPLRNLTLGTDRGAAISDAIANKVGTNGALRIAARSGEEGTASDAIRTLRSQALAKSQKGALSSGWMAQYAKVSRAIKGAEPDVIAHVEGDASAAARLTPKQLEAANALKGQLSDMYSAARKAGVPINELQDYFPRYLTDEARSAIGVEQPVSGGANGARAASFERGRTITPESLGVDTNAAVRQTVNEQAVREGLVPEGTDFYKSNPNEVMPTYIRAVSNRIARANLMRSLSEQGVLGAAPDFGKVGFANRALDSASRVVEAATGRASKLDDARLQAALAASDAGKAQAAQGAVADQLARTAEAGATQGRTPLEVADALAPRGAAVEPGDARLVSQVANALGVEPHEVLGALPEIIQKYGSLDAFLTRVGADATASAGDAAGVLATPERLAGLQAQLAQETGGAARARLQSQIDEIAAQLPQPPPAENIMSHLTRQDLAEMQRASPATRTGLQDQIDAITANLAPGPMDVAAPQHPLADQLQGMAPPQDLKQQLESIAGPRPEPQPQAAPASMPQWAADAIDAGQMPRDQLSQAIARSDAASAAVSSRPADIAAAQAEIQTRNAAAAAKLADPNLSPAERALYGQQHYLGQQADKLYSASLAESDPAIKRVAELEAKSYQAQQEILAAQGGVDRAAEHQVLTMAQQKALQQTLDEGTNALVTGTDFMAPRDVAEALNYVDKIKQPGEFQKFADYYHTAFRYIKAMELALPGTAFRHSVGAFFNNYLAGVDLATYGRLVADERALERGTLTGERATILSQIRDDIGHQYGQASAGEIGATRSLRGSGLFTQGLNPFSAHNLGTRFVHGTIGASEDFSRRALAYDVMLKGGSIEDAVAAVNKFHFNFSDLSAAERKITQNVIPFYTWTSRNLGLQMQQMMENPGKYMRLYRIKQNIEANAKADPSSVIARLISGDPSAVHIGGSSYVTGQMLPFVHALDAVLPVNPQTGEFDIKAPLSQVHPLIKMPIEELFGKEFFNDIPLSGTRVAPNYAFGNTLSRGQAYGLESVLPILARARALLPTNEKGKADRATVARLNALGIPVRLNDKEAIDRENKARYYENTTPIAKRVQPGQSTNPKDYYLDQKPGTPGYKPIVTKSGMSPVVKWVPQGSSLNSRDYYLGKTKSNPTYKPPRRKR